MVKFMENILKVGYSKVDITPKLGIDIAGYFKTRKADGVLDNLYAIALTLSLGDKTTAIISIDCLVVYKEIADKCFISESQESGAAPSPKCFIVARERPLPKR